MHDAVPPALLLDELEVVLLLDEELLLDELDEELLLDELDEELLLDELEELLPPVPPPPPAPEVDELGSNNDSSVPSAQLVPLTTPQDNARPNSRMATFELVFADMVSGYGKRADT